jgi:hypothetical protein
VPDKAPHHHLVGVCRFAPSGGSGWRKPVTHPYEWLRGHSVCATVGSSGDGSEEETA